MIRASALSLLMLQALPIDNPMSVWHQWPMAAIVAAIFIWSATQQRRDRKAQVDRDEARQKVQDEREKALGDQQAKMTERLISALEDSARSNTALRKAIEARPCIALRKNEGAD